MGKYGRTTQVHPNAARELQTFWDGCVQIDVSAADYVVSTELGSDVWVRGIESGDTSGGAVIKVDHEDYLNGGSRTNQNVFVIQGAIKAPHPNITKVYNSGTTAASIKLYYHRKRA
jgi:hypothetical protein